MSTEVQWEEPPRERRGKSGASYVDLVKELKEHPGKWARIPDLKSAGFTTRVRQGVIKDFRPAGHFEATGRLEPAHADGRKRMWQVWVRYVGEEGGSDV